MTRKKEILKERNIESKVERKEETLKLSELVTIRRSVFEIWIYEKSESTLQ